MEIRNIFDYIDDEYWKYHKEEYNNRDSTGLNRNEIVESFKKDISFPANPGTKTYNKELEINRTSFEPKNILDTVKQSYYEAKYEYNILDVPQEKIKEVFDRLYLSYSKEEIGHAKNRRKGEEKERKKDLQDLLSRKAKKYNL